MDLKNLENFISQKFLFSKKFAVSKNFTFSEIPHSPKIPQSRGILLGRPKIFHRFSRIKTKFYVLGLV
jgi:hypothetical protein